MSKTPPPGMNQPVLGKETFVQRMRALLPTIVTGEGEPSSSSSASSKPGSATPSKAPSSLASSIKSAVSKDDEIFKAPEPTGKEHHAGNGYYKNPWPSGQSPAWQAKVPFSRTEEIHPSIKRIKTVKPDFEKEVASNELKFTWLGHAGVLIQLPVLKPGQRPITLLIDPIFSERASPSQWAGPARRLPTPCKVEDLPHIDFFFASHNHYDHLDLPTVEALIKKGEDRTRYVVPLGLRQWLEATNLPSSQIIEQDWWDDLDFSPSDLGFSEEDDELGRLKITCVPAQHNSGRTGWDAGASLWCGFVVEQFGAKPSEAPERTAVYLAGDTGYRSDPHGPTCPAFREIGDKFGPFDFSSIPIWRGGTLAFISSVGIRLNPEALTQATHATPKDAVCIHQDVKSRSSMGMHFATFSGSDDESTFPVSLLQEACEAAKIEMDAQKEGGFGVYDIGETVVIKVASGGR